MSNINAKAEVEVEIVDTNVEFRWKLPPPAMRDSFKSMVPIPTVKDWIERANEIGLSLSGGRNIVPYTTVDILDRSRYRELLTVPGLAMYIAMTNTVPKKLREQLSLLESQCDTIDILFNLSPKADDPIHLADIPYEIMYPPAGDFNRVTAGLLAKNSPFAIQRRISGIWPPRPARTRRFGVLKVALFLSPQYFDDAQLSLANREMDTIHKCFRHKHLRTLGLRATQVARIRGGRKDRATRARLLQAGESSDIIHFIGHGRVKTRQEKQQSELHILLQTDDGENDWIPISDIAQPLVNMRPPPLLVLGGCWTSYVSTYASGFPLVVGHQFPITHEAASAFSNGFYDELTRSNDVGLAMREGRNRIAGLNGLPGYEYGTPVLFCNW